MPIVTTDPIDRLLRMTRLMWSNVDRAARARQMEEWALLHRVRADGSNGLPEPVRFAPDRGSSLDLDNAYTAPERGDILVSSTARFPVMNAAECLVGAAQVYGAAFQQKRTSTLSTGILCRSAIENAAKTIWLLADPRRTVRRARCLGFVEREIGYQKGYIAVETRFLASRNDERLPTDRERFDRAERQYRERLNYLTALPKSARQRPSTSYEFFVNWAGDWIDKNPPPHVTEADGLVRGMATSAERFYAVGSGFVHGYKWMSAYLGTEEDVLAQVADSLSAALIMTECAVALYEAQATHPARPVVRQKNYPGYLEPTVAAWRPLYEQPGAAFPAPLAMPSQTGSVAS